MNLHKILDTPTPFTGKDGSMKLHFQAEGEGDPVSTAKKAIKQTEIGSVLYFQIGEKK